MNESSPDPASPSGQSEGHEPAWTDPTRLALTIAAGLSVSAALPGVDTKAPTTLLGIDLKDSILWPKAGPILGATAIYCLAWYALHIIGRSFELVKKHIGRSVKAATGEASLVFPALTSLAIPFGPISMNIEIDFPLSEATARAIKQLLRLLLGSFLMVAWFTLVYWLVCWISMRIGVGLQIAGPWQALGGGAVSGAVMVLVYPLLCMVQITVGPE